MVKWEIYNKLFTQVINKIRFINIYVYMIESKGKYILLFIYFIFPYNAIIGLVFLSVYLNIFL